MAVAGQHLDGSIGDVVACDPADVSVPGGTAEDTVLVDEERRDVEVHRVLQERPLQTALAKVLLGGPVLTSQGESAVGGGTQERGVNDATYPGVRGRIDGAAVLLHPRRGLAPRDEEDRVRARERFGHRISVVVAGADLHLRAGQRRCPSGIPNDQALLDPPLGETSSDTTAELAGGSGDRHGAHHIPPVLFWMPGMGQPTVRDAVVRRTARLP